MPAAEAAEAVELRGEEGKTDSTSCQANEEHCSQGGAATPRYSIPKLEGAWTLQELVVMDLSKDPRMTKVRRRDLPEAFWDERRRARNRRRTLQRKENNRRRAASLQKEEGEQQSVEDNGHGQEATQGRRGERTEEERKQAVQAHLAQKAGLEEALRSGQRVAVDCSLCHEGASWREIRSLAKQLQLSVGVNKKAPAPLNLHFVGLAGRVKEFAEQHMNALRWPAHLREAPALELFPREDLVLLSPDADAPFLELDRSKVYVIGGLVDRSPLKNATAAFAAKHGLAVARLPVMEFLEQQQPEAGEEQQGDQVGQHAAERPEGLQQGQRGRHAAERPMQPQESQHDQQEQHAEGRPLQPLKLQHEQQGQHPAERPEHAGQGPSTDGQAEAQHSAVQLSQQQAGPSGQGADCSQEQCSTAAGGLDEQGGSQSTAATLDACEHAAQAAGGQLAASKKKDGKGFILNINSVIEVLLAVNAGQEWGQALRGIVPQRKQAQRFGGTLQQGQQGRQ